MNAQVYEFDCADCGSHVVDVSRQARAFNLCATCVHVPGWMDEAELVAIFDPDRVMPAQMPAIDSDKNYCETCSPFGFPYGEPGECCSRCGAPMVLTDEQVARGRALRNNIYGARGPAA